MNKLTKILPLLAPCLALVGCQDEDFGFEAKDIQYQTEFRKAFGKIDPEQDWNLATRATVTVNVAFPSQIRIYALNAGKYQIVGDYANVSGTQTLGVDVREGVCELMVTDGSSAVKTTVGGNISFNGATRALYAGTYEDIIVTKGTDEERKIFTREEVQAWNAILPEIAVNSESNGLQSMATHKVCNLNKVTRDFLMVSTGTFYLYPLFFLTSQTNTVGLYIKDGSDYSYVPLYTIKDGEELQTGDWGAWATISGDAANDANKIDYDYLANGYTSENYQPAEWVEHTAPEGTNNGYVGGKFYKYNTATETFEWQDAAETLENGTRFKTISSYAQSRTYNWSNVGYSMANADGSLPASVQKVRSRPVKVSLPEGTVFGFYTQIGGTPTTPTPTFYSQSELNSDMDYILAFDSEGVVDPTNTTLSTTKHACHVVNFEIDGTTYLGFEDWTNISTNSDMDFNDVMMVISGAKPTVIDEDPTSASWVLACEDLGNTFDTDYNDVVFKIEHVSGRETATVTPLAAGGTLASHIFFNDQDLGEIHQSFGVSPQISGEYQPINVGSSRGNAGHQKTISVAKDFSMTSYQVGESNQGNANMGGFCVKVLPKDTPAGSTNFGSASVVSAPEVGATPEIICLPYTYTIENDPQEGKKTTYTWAWSQELKTLAAAPGSTTYGTGSYPEFAGWVTNHQNHTDWYMHPETDLTVEESSIEESMTGGGSTGDDGNQTIECVISELEEITVWGTQYHGQTITVPSENVTAGNKLKITSGGENKDFGTEYGSSSYAQGNRTELTITDAMIGNTIYVTLYGSDSITKAVIEKE